MGSLPLIFLLLLDCTFNFVYLISLAPRLIPFNTTIIIAFFAQFFTLALFAIIMLTLETEHLDYSELSRVYLAGFHSSRFDDFLNTTQTGFAHSSSGTDVRILLKALFTSISFCTLQLSFFCILRPIFRNLYQPRCYCVPTKEKMEPLPNGLFSWIIPTMKYSINYYLSMGLDTYFFVRFISVLLLFFLVVGITNIIVLVPVNWTGSSLDYSSTGLDKLSISNIASSKVNRLNFHFVMSLSTVAAFHWLILYELDSFVKIRQLYLSSTTHQSSLVAKTLLISNIPDNLKDVKILEHLFSVFPGGINTVWLSYDFSHMNFLVSQAQDAIEILEQGQMQLLRRHLTRKFRSQSLWGLYRKKRIGRDIEIDRIVDPSLAPYFYPPIYTKPIYLPMLDRTLKFKFAGVFRTFRLEKRVAKIEWAYNALNVLHEQIEEEKAKLHNGSLRTHDKVFIEFNERLGALVANQCLLSQVQGTFNHSLIEVHPNDIIWDNIARRSTYIFLIENYIVTLIFVGITILYIIPVSFIGLVSQIPLITHLLPFLRWINNFPEEARDTISHLLPSILLSILTEIVMITFRFLSYFKGKQTGATRELNLQHWYFSFLFVQQFLVITILASITVIFKQIVDLPTSIPVLLALNLPKAATFFFQYLTVKALTFCGNNFLRISDFILHLTIYKLLDNTPRKKFLRLTKLMKIKWGTVYPVYSVYSSIGLVYTIISPMISIFILFILGLVLLYYKYALRFVYSHINESESQGKMYPRALMHLYTGVYFMECCMIGILFLLRNTAGDTPQRIQGYIMCMVFLGTIFGQYTIYNKYSQYFSYSPTLNDKQFLDAKNIQRNEINSSKVDNMDKSIHTDDNYLKKKLLYLHKSFTYEYPPLWLPSDPLGISEQQVQSAEEKVKSLQKGQTKGALIDFRKLLPFIEIKVTDAPPGYK